MNKKIVLFFYFFSFFLVAKSQTADFTYSTSNGLFCNPATVQFKQTASGSPVGYVWSFGNGTGSNSPSPAVTYANAGSYVVRLIIIYPRSTATVTKTIVINPAITATIAYDRNYICTPGTINFTAGGTGNISSYTWDFGDGSGTVTTATKTIAHNFAAFGTYTVTLLSTDVSGCSASGQTVISVKAPPITGTVTPTSGCIPANVTFNATVTVPTGSTVSNYTWNFGDGSPVTVTAVKNTNHIYAATGSYSPTVMITTSEGCTNTYSFGGIAFGTPPINLNAYAVKPVICGSETAQLVAKATNANTYRWNFGDGTAATVSDTITQHKYKTLGIKNVTVTPAFNGCNGNTATFQVNVIGVIANFIFSNTCANKKTFTFTNTSQGNLSTVSWDFGDGSPVENTLNAMHTFPTSGTFVTTLTVMDSITGCSDAYPVHIYTADPALVNPDTSICKNSSTTFTVINNDNNPAVTYTWFVAGRQAGPFSDSSYTLIADTLGYFNDYVIVDNGVQYCQDTLRLNNTLLVRGPDLSFTAPASLCLTGSYAVNNTSHPFIPSDSVTTWYWNYGDNSGNDSVYQPPPYVYKNAGTFKVKLTGIDINGCKDTLVKPVIIHPLPYLYVIPPTDTLCTGKPDTLIAFHNNTIQWTPSGSLSCATCDTVLSNAASNTKYYITATTPFGCTITDSIQVNVFPPFTAVPSVDNPYICLNDTIQLNASPPGKRIVWTPATGLSNANNYGTIASPSQTTTYTATLTDSAGCFTSSTSITVNVKSLPMVNAGPDQYYPYNAPFTINPVYGNDITSYSWTPANLLSCSDCPDPSGTADSSVTFYITVTSDSGCISKDTITIYVACKDAYLLIPNAFTPNNDGHNDFFYPLTRGVKTIIRFSIYNRFGQLVYEATNFPPNNQAYGWNGQLNGADQQSDVFVYYLEALCDSGEKLYKKGSITLIR